MTCVACRQGFDWECRESGNCNVNNSAEPVNLGLSQIVHDSNNAISGGSVDVPVSNAPIAEEVEEREFRTYKDDSALKDQQSTGRKRAAKMYPLDPEAECDWKMKKNCGGGKFPIVGCIEGKQDARHHGPDKNTLNNEQGNVHRICHTCHNRWHTLNDEGYVWNEVHAPHMPMFADVVDMALNEDFWEGRKIVKAKD